MSLQKCVRAGLLAVVPAVLISCTGDGALPTEPAARPAAAVTQPDSGPAALNLEKRGRSGYVLASGRH